MQKTIFDKLINAAIASKHVAVLETVVKMCSSMPPHRHQSLINVSTFAKACLTANPQLIATLFEHGGLGCDMSWENVTPLVVAIGLVNNTAGRMA